MSSSSSDSERTTPPKFDNLNSENNSVMDIDRIVFDGFQMDYVRIINDALQIKHTLSWGSREQNPGYQIAAFSHFGGKNDLAMATVTPEHGSVFGKLELDLDPSWHLSASAQTGAHGSQGLLGAEIARLGRDSRVACKLDSRQTALSYVQSVTRRLAIGVQCCAQTTGAAVAQAALRYARSTGPFMGVWTAVYERSLNPMGDVKGAVTALGYALRRGKKIWAVEAKFERTESVPFLFSVLSVGYHYTMRTCSIRAKVDSWGRALLVLEEPLGESILVALSSAMDYRQSDFRVGLGVTLHF